MAANFVEPIVGDMLEEAVGNNPAVTRIYGFVTSRRNDGKSVKTLQDICLDFWETELIATFQGNYGDKSDGYGTLFRENLTEVVVSAMYCRLFNRVAVRGAGEERVPYQERETYVEMNSQVSRLGPKAKFDLWRVFFDAQWGRERALPLLDATPELYASVLKHLAANPCPKLERVTLWYNWITKKSFARAFNNLPALKHVTFVGPIREETLDIVRKHCRGLNSLEFFPVRPVGNIPTYVVTRFMESLTNLTSLRLDLLDPDGHVFKSESIEAFSSLKNLRELFIMSDVFLKLDLPQDFKIESLRELTLGSPGFSRAGLEMSAVYLTECRPDPVCFPNLQAVNWSFLCIDQTLLKCPKFQGFAKKLTSLEAMISKNCDVMDVLSVSGDRLCNLRLIGDRFRLSESKEWSITDQDQPSCKRLTKVVLDFQRDISQTEILWLVYHAPNLKTFSIRARTLLDWKSRLWSGLLNDHKWTLESLEVLDWTLRAEETHPVKSSFVDSLLEKCANLKRLSNLLFIDWDSRPGESSKYEAMAQETGLSCLKAESEGPDSRKWFIPKLGIWFTQE